MRRRKKLFAGGTAIKKQGSSRIKAPSLPAKPKNKMSPAKKQVGKAIPIAKKKPVVQKPKAPAKIATGVKASINSKMAKISKSAPKKLKKVSGAGSRKPTSSAKQKIKRKIRTGG
jgi:hypothetical protein|tara:strand:- start:482 stop:826 length:345 start_codon:yes stop_codon:yes gene_type:complete